MDNFTKLLTKLGIGIVLIILVLVFMPLGIITVQPNEVAVEVDKVGHKVIEIPQGVGYHLYNRWTTDMIPYTVSARSYPSDTAANENNKEYTMDLKTNDGQNISVDLTIIYALIVNEVPHLHAQIGSHYEDQILLPQIRSEARLVIGNYSAEEIYNGKVRDLIQQAIKDRLTKVLAKYPAIQVQDALMRHFSFSPQFEQAIEAKKLAAQQVEIFKNQALAQEEKAKQQEAEARGGKLQAVQEAEGRAESAKIEADANRYKLEQEAAGNLAKNKADAEGKRLQAEALGGGSNVVALEFAKNIPPTMQTFGIPMSGNNSSIMDISGVFGKMFSKKGDQ